MSRLARPITTPYIVIEFRRSKIPGGKLVFGVDRIAERPGASIERHRFTGTKGPESDNRVVPRMEALNQHPRRMPKESGVRNFGASRKAKSRLPEAPPPSKRPRAMNPSPDWNRIASDPDFPALQRAKRRFIVPATIFFLVYYMALPVLVGYWPELMKSRLGQDELGLSLRALAVLHGVDRLRPLRPRRPQVGPHERRTSRQIVTKPCSARRFQFTPALGMFLAFVAVTLVITYFSARKATGSSAYFAAGRSHHRLAERPRRRRRLHERRELPRHLGHDRFCGYDGFMYSVGWLVAYLTVLLLVAEPLRNAGKYTMADLLAYRLKPRPVRAMASLSTLTVSTFYMIAQMVGAGGIVKLLIGVRFRASASSASACS